MIFFNIMFLQYHNFQKELRLEPQFFFVLDFRKISFIIFFLHSLGRSFIIWMNVR
ncbi:hypothetical protein HMPREF3293_02161 [Christensenella minuta]|uniref:Uncharacterized protein n=1 Tax=Christensenella minuta TaxID=626937 RepID=A0A136Q2L1_9FIRM|nr:hypothetical protein HMPREF3293_02161 [Christensenella minuta]